MRIRTRTCVYLAISAAILAAATSVIADDVTDNNGTANSNVARQSATIDLNGNGRQATKKFMLSKGLVVIHTTYKGPSNFIVGLLDADGEHVLSMFNHIDDYEATRGFQIPKDGQYLLDVQAEGDWAFQIQQPRPKTGETTPTTITGDRTNVSEFLALKKGLTVFRFKFEGKGRFVVNLVDQNGRQLEQLINNLDEFEASKPVKISQQGIYFLNISGTGLYHIDVE